jgi:predicted ATPase
MITRLEIDGFKTFKDFAADFGPLNVIAGANGSGKSNLFDAIRWLSYLVQPHTQESSGAWRLLFGRRISQIRGAGDQSFTILPNQQIVGKIRMAVELFLDPTVTDLKGVEHKLDYTRFRYEVEVTRQENVGRASTFYISHELLTAVLPENDNWIKNNNLTIENGWLQKLPDALRDKKLIYSTAEPENNIVLHLATGHTYEQTNGGLPETSMLSRVTDAQSIFALAVQQELKKWVLLDITSTLLRLANDSDSSERLQQRTLPLGAVLADLQTLDEYSLKDISREVSLLIPEIKAIETVRDEYRNENIIFAHTRDGRKLHWQSLSDGTLKVLVLATIAHHPTRSGVLLLEEPEEAVHPGKLDDIARILTYFPTNFVEPDEQNYPLRQLFVTTHSPVLISQPEILNSLYFAENLKQHFAYVSPESPSPAAITRIEKVRTRTELETTSNGDKKFGYHTLNQVKHLLATTDSSKALQAIS